MILKVRIWLKSKHLFDRLEVYFSKRPSISNGTKEHVRNIVIKEVDKYGEQAIEKYLKTINYHINRR